MKAARNQAFALLAEALTAREGFDWKRWAERVHVLLTMVGKLPELPRAPG